MNTYTLPAPFYRQMPSRGDDKIVRHWIEVQVSDLSESFPLDANPRDPNIDRSMYRKIELSLTDPESTGHTKGAFGYRHSGLTLVADSVQVRDDVAHITFGPGSGLVNGGHSHALIRSALEKLDLTAAPDEYVLLEILTGVPDELIPEIADGRNTSMQVKRTSLADLKGSFDFLKEAMSSPDEVIWHEGDSGSMKAEHLIALISAFDIETYGPGGRQPNDVYLKVTNKFDLIQSDPDRFRRLSPVIDDIVRLFHLITAEAASLWQGVDDSASHGRVKGLVFLDHPRKPGPIPMYDANRQIEHPMKYAAALVFTTAFRYLLEVDPNGETYGDYPAVKWRADYDEVVGLWETHAHRLMRTFYAQLEQAGRKLNACVRSGAVWAAVYNDLVVADVTSAAKS